MQLHVFISSKMVELAEERKAVYELLQSLDTGLFQLHPWIFEGDAPASNASIREVYLNALKQSALYIGLFWNQYGDWTVDEFDRATEWGIDRHIYVKNLNAEQRDRRLQEFLDKQCDVVSGITPKWFTTIDELRDHVQKSIQVWLEDYSIKRRSDSSAIFAQDAEDIPERPSRLVGRDDLISETLGLLDEQSRVLLQGFGGMGKTALAATIAAQWLEDDHGAVIWLRAGSADANMLFEALAHPFDAHQQIASLTRSEKVKAVRALLAESGATLLVLDDAWDGAALNEIIKAVPRSMAVLVTARQRYALDEILEVSKLKPVDALSLLRHHARKDYADDPAAHELCLQLGYHAFALEIAGKTLKIDKITPQELLQRIEAAPHNLAMPVDFAEEGRSSITELLDASLYALDASSQRAFLSFGGLFAPGATIELLARCMNWTEAQVSEALVKLQRRGLCEQVKSAGTAQPVYRIHDLAYSYVRTIFIRMRHDHSTSIAACRAYTLDHAPHLESLDAEQGNIFGAAEMAHQSGDSDTLITIVRALIGPYTNARGYSLSFLKLLDAAIAATERMGDEQREIRHHLLSKRGNSHYDRGELRLARSRYEEALSLARELNLPDREVILLSVIGKVYTDLKSDRAAAALQEAYQRATELQDDFLIGYALEARGYHAQSNGDYAATRAIFEEGVALAERTGDDEALFYALLNLGAAEKDLEESQAALSHHQKALEIARKHDNRVWMGYALQGIAEDHEKLANEVQASQCYREALMYFQQSGMHAKVVEIESYLKLQN